MKQSTLFLSLIFLVIFHFTTLAQFNPHMSGPMLNAGFGLSGYGVPIYASLDFGVEDQITIGAGLSYQSNTERIGFNDIRWRHSILGIGVRGSYHFNALLELPEVWDVYGGLSLQYFVWNTSLKGAGEGIYNGAGSGGIGIAARIGGRYFFNENFAANLELGGGSVLSSGRIGFTMLL